MKMILEFIKNKFFLCITSFIVGFIVGHVLSTPIFELKILNIYLDNLDNSIAQILSFTPTPNFLSDVAAFESVVIAIAVPLSFEIVSRISERYQSEVISKQFLQEWEIKWLPRFLMVNIVLAIALRFFVQNNPSSVEWRIFAWITFAVFLSIATIFLSFIEKLKRYMIDTELILEELYDEAEKFLE